MRQDYLDSLRDHAESLGYVIAVSPKARAERARRKRRIHESDLVDAAEAKAEQEAK